MALYKHFKKETDCNSVFITMREIEKADEKVKQVLDDSDRNSCSGMLTIRCKYNAYTAEQRAQIGRYAAENGNTKVAIFLLCLVQKSMNRHVLELCHQKRIEICACLCMRESTSAGIRQIKLSPNFDFFNF